MNESHPAKLVDRAASALARLKAKAAASGRSHQLCLQLFCQEEFLRRLARSRYAGNLVLKGGLFLYTLTHYDSRVTLDIDFLLRHLSDPQGHMRGMLEEIIATDVGNGFISFDIKEIKPIAVTKKYAGVGVRLEARIKNTRTPIRIDFGVGDCIYPEAQRHRIPTQLPDYETPEVHAYSLESSVAEKLDAAMSLMEASSRMKDYHDIYYLAHRFDFKGETLRDALRATFANRSRQFDAETFADFLSLTNDPGMQLKWNAYARKTGIAGLEFPTLMDTIARFISPPYHAARAEGAVPGEWAAASLQWS